MKINFLYRDKNWLVFAILFLILASFVLVIINSRFLEQIEKWIVRDVENELSLHMDDLESFDQEIMNSCGRILLAWNHQYDLFEKDSEHLDMFKGYTFCDQEFVELSKPTLSWSRRIGPELEYLLRYFPQKNTELMNSLDELGKQKDKIHELYRLIMKAGVHYSRGEYEEAAEIKEKLALDNQYKDTEEAMFANVSCLEIGEVLDDHAMCQRALKRIREQLKNQILGPSAFRFLEKHLKQSHHYNFETSEDVNEVKKLIVKYPIEKFENYEIFHNLWLKDREFLKKKFFRTERDRAHFISATDDSILWMIYQDSDEDKLVVAALDIRLWHRKLVEHWQGRQATYSFALNISSRGEELESRYAQSAQLLISSMKAYAGDLDVDQKKMTAVIDTQTKVGYMAAFMGFTILGIGLLMGVGTALYYQNLSKLKSNFVSTVSHELRTPLTSIQMFVETLKERRYKDEAEREEYIGIIEKEASRLSGLIERLLTFSSLEQDKKSLNMTTVSLCRIGQYVADIVAPQFEAADLKLNRQFPEEDVEIEGDGEALVDVFINLLSNTIKYAPDGKEVDFVIFKEDQRAVVEVRDRGPGIPVAERKRMFSAFVRQDVALSSETDGAGLGLFIVKGLVERHEGSVKILSREGGGAVFKLQFPLSSLE